MLSLLTPFDIQLEFSLFCKKMRKEKGYSTKALSEKTGVPDSTIRKFEKTGEISFRQFLMLYAETAKLTELQQLTQQPDTPKNLDEVLKNARS
ncbi:MAG: helix-turn-helix transcriptional regulator [Oceanospirillaceae bacterium]|nr:helix-turn-helix transcriptional regulator [Oceanospirillaceae bacterium]